MMLPIIAIVALTFALTESGPAPGYGGGYNTGGAPFPAGMLGAATSGYPAGGTVITGGGYAAGDMGDSRHTRHLKRKIRRLLRKLACADNSHTLGQQCTADRTKFWFCRPNEDGSTGTWERVSQMQLLTNLGNNYDPSFADQYRVRFQSNLCGPEHPFGSPCEDPSKRWFCQPNDDGRTGNWMQLGQAQYLSNLANLYDPTFAAQYRIVGGLGGGYQQTVPMAGGYQATPIAGGYSTTGY
jgi:hypothetical protein